MAKNVLIFSDGTGQGARSPKADCSNVWRLYEATCDAAPTRQIAYYDAGLGAPEHEDERSAWRTAYNFLSRATGLGISRNIKSCYDALIRSYAPDDRIFLFGFSRGAYTVRSLAGVVKLCGIPQHDRTGANLLTDNKARRAAVEEAVEHIYKHYGDDEAAAERVRRGEEYRAAHASLIAAPHFIGVWDTVRALGIPGSSGLIFFRHRFHDAKLDPAVRHARHALSIDENREAFKPELWEETEDDRRTGRSKQVWFPGVHSDVGGGYPESESGLADLALDWMLSEAGAIDQPAIVDVSKLKLSPSYRAMQHDERSGAGWFWREGTRESFAPSNFHRDAVERRFQEPEVVYPTARTAYRPRALVKHPAFSKFY